VDELVKLDARPPLVIGIAGGSGSGKSTVVARVVKGLGEESVAILDHDAYYRDLSHLRLEERIEQNFDHPDALETELLCLQLDQLKAGAPILKPVYDFTIHCRTDRTQRVEARPVIIVEGILVLAYPALVDRLDLKIFVHADDDIRLARRIRRDIVERGRSIDAVLTQYEHTVRPMYLEFVEPSIRNADLIVPRGGHNKLAIEVLVGHLKSFSA
jgi:uridine kinase